MDYQASLTLAGLTKDQASIYEVLVKHGTMPASRISRLSPVSRTLTYKVLGELGVLGLIEKREEPGQVATFAPEHPLKLKELIEKKREAATDAQTAMEGIFGKLLSDFNLMSGQPGIRIMEGVAGVAELYEDICREKKDLLLIRSPLDEHRTELGSLVGKQLKAQAHLGIHVRALTPLVPETVMSIEHHDTSRLVERRIIPKYLFDIPAQLIVYGDRVALTSYEGQLITTIIQNSAIEKTFRILFEYIWNAATPEHDRISASLSPQKSD